MDNRSNISHLKINLFSLVNRHIIEYIFSYLDTLKELEKNKYICRYFNNMITTSLKKSYAESGYLSEDKG
jgi:hypothetical protein